MGVNFLSIGGWNTSRHVVRVAKGGALRLESPAAPGPYDVTCSSLSWYVDFATYSLFGAAEPGLGLLEFFRGPLGMISSDPRRPWRRFVGQKGASLVPEQHIGKSCVLDPLPVTPHIGESLKAIKHGAP